jgi:hypothetical protein
VVYKVVITKLSYALLWVLIVSLLSYILLLLVSWCVVSVVSLLSYIMSWPLLYPHVACTYGTHNPSLLKLDKCRCFRPANLPRGTRGSRLCGGDRDRETENSKVCARTRDTRFIQVRTAKLASPTSCLVDQVWRPALGVELRSGQVRCPARYTALLYKVQGAGS